MGIKLMDTVRLINDKVVHVDLYVRSKRRDLVEFGYSGLTEETVRKQLEAVRTGGDLDVIGMFIEKDLHQSEIKKKQNQSGG
jgi:hypothetical protein